MGASCTAVLRGPASRPATVLDILKQALVARVADVLPEPTPLELAAGLTAVVRHPVYLKREDLTPVFSFKIRGAYNCVSGLSSAELERGVIAASAGNHAQGVAHAAARLGCDALIVMPRTTPQIKVAAVRSYGANVELHGDNYTDAYERCAELAAETQRAYIPPFDHPDVIAGQATVALEILRQAPRDLGCVFVPVGGGGLAAGVAAVIKELRPDVQVVGVEPDDSDAMRQSIEAGGRVRLAHVGIFADGVAVREVGELTFGLCRRYLDACITVDTDEICAAIQDAFNDTRSILEPAGALALAGLKRKAAESGLPSGAVVAIASGANMSFSRLGYVSERAALGEHGEALFSVTIPERPGAFLSFCQRLGPRSVTEFNYRLASRSAVATRPSASLRRFGRVGMTVSISLTTSSPRPTSDTWWEASPRKHGTKYCMGLSFLSGPGRCYSF
jgi:threonine dehydratase